MDRKEAISIVRKNWPDGKHQLSEALETLIPELKESESERIRKALIRGIKSVCKEEEVFTGGFTCKQIVSWLENQGKEEYVLKSFKVEHGKYYYCIKDYFQGGKKQASMGDVVQALRGLAIMGLDDASEFFLPVNEIKPGVNAITKFKIGDFIANDYCRGQVVEITDDAYLLDTGQGIPFSCEHNAHLWTIQDAKDGDILNSPSHHLIWIYEDNEHYHACVNMNHVTDNVSTDGLISIPTDARPATIDERIILFSTLGESGHSWDEDKKKVKKIEQKNNCMDCINRKGCITCVDGNMKEIMDEQKIGNKIKYVYPKFRIGDVIEPINPDEHSLPVRVLSIEKKTNSYYCESDDKTYYISIPIKEENEYKLVKWNSTWSEEDDINFSDTMWAIEQARTIAKDENDMGNLWYAERWLKSLKDRIQPQPKPEWSEEDREMRMKVLKYLSTRCNVFEYEEVEKWLNSLKDRVGNFDDGYKVGFSAAKYNQWKPSEQQMEALLYETEAWDKDSINGQNLIYNDLKKLKG